MSVQDVGIENLPNIYIHKIEIFGGTIIVTCLIKDSIERKSWYDREQMMSLRVKVGLVYSGEMFAEIKDGLNSGLDSLYNYENDAPGILIQTRKANDFSLGEEFLEQDMGFYYSDFTFRIPNFATTTADAVLYAACCVSDLGFGAPQYDKYYGPMSSEIIKSDGQINAESGYFYFPEDVENTELANIEYGGPVHVHEGNYMQGSEHTTTQHYPLRYVRERNIKIIIDEDQYSSVSTDTTTPVS